MRRKRSHTGSELQQATRPAKRAAPTISCPRCQGVFDTRTPCSAQFALTQAQEFQDPAYFAVHHLSVSCYMLQHAGYSSSGWQMARFLLSGFLHGGWCVDETGRWLRAELASGRYRDRLTADAPLPELESIIWSSTLADVRLHSSAIYCADVRHWAQSVLDDTAEIAGSIGRSPLFLS